MNPYITLVIAGTHHEADEFKYGCMNNFNHNVVITVARSDKTLEKFDGFNHKLVKLVVEIGSSVTWSELNRIGHPVTLAPYIRIPI